MHVSTEVVNKRQMLIEIQSLTNVATENTLFVGDELKDLEILNLIVAPAIAVKFGIGKAGVALTRTGGNSCIRQLTDENVKVHE